MANYLKAVKAEEFQFVLGRGQMLEEFDSGLMGSKEGDNKTIAFAFPEDYGNEDLLLARM